MAQSETVATAADDARGGATLEGDAAAARVVLPGSGLPTSEINEALPHLRRPFAPAAIKFKVQSVFRECRGCVIVAYIDARLVIERLNAVVGGGWTADYSKTGDDKLMRCDLTVLGVTRRDVGGSSKGLSKDLVSDALKRAAVHFGVGVSVYAMPEIIWYADRAGAGLEKRRVRDKESLVLTDQGHAALRVGYEEWLKNTGMPRFGEPMDHGDTFAEVYDADAAAALDDEPEAAPATPEPLTDERAVALVEQIEILYAGIAASSRAEELPPARFRSWLDAARGSHEQLEQLLGVIRARHSELAGGAE